MFLLVEDPFSGENAARALRGWGFAALQGEVDRAVAILAREASCARAAQTVGIAAVGTSAKSV